MKTKSLLPIAFLMGVALAAACAPQATATTLAATESPAAPVQGDPTEGQARLMNDLQAAGAEVVLGEQIEQQFFTVRGRILKVNGQDVQVFEYATPEAMETDAAQVAADGGSIGTSMVTWMATPHFFKSGRLLVLYVGDDTEVLDALERALGVQFAGG